VRLDFSKSFFIALALMSKPGDETKFFELPPERFNGKIPFILTNIVDELNRLHAEEVEGLFRLSGHELEMNNLIALFDQGPVSQFPQKLSIHSLAGVIKRYLRKMAVRDGLIPTDLYDPVLASMCTKDPAQRIVLLKKLVPLLNPIRQKMLAFLCRYWKSITDHIAVNKMTVENMAVCVSQVILVSPTGLDPFETQRQVGLAANAMAILIGQVEEMFPNVIITHADYCTAEEIEDLRAPKLNMANVNHLIVRDTFRRVSRIPWLPDCRIERHPAYQLPLMRPEDTIPIEPIELTQSRVFTREKVRAVLRSVLNMEAMTVSQPSGTTDATELDAVFELDSLPRPDVDTPEPPVSEAPHDAALEDIDPLAPFGGGDAAVAVADGADVELPLPPDEP
jgi:hypothetical protein